MMKKLIWLGSAYNDLFAFPKDAKREAGFNLDRVQHGLEPLDWKPMRSIGSGVKEVRIHLKNEYRVMYVAKFKEAIYVLHAMSKKTKKTPKKEIEIAKKRYSEMINLRNKT